MMLRIISWLRGKGEIITPRPLPVLPQGILHIVAIYVIARNVVPWLPGSVNGNPQYFAHMVLFSLFTGLVGGLVGGRFLRHRIVRFVWMCPVLFLALAIVFGGHGVYPTMPFQSDWGEAFRFYFTSASGPPVGSPGNGNVVPFLFQLEHIRVQFLFVVPVVVGIAYSLGALLSGLLRIPIPELSFKNETSAPSPRP
jgi:hypothetical protein